MRKLPNINQVRDALYNCHPRAGGDFSYARGIVVGLFSGLMASGLSFEETLRLVKGEVASGISDLGVQDVHNCLPESWRKQYLDMEPKGDG